MSLKDIQLKESYDSDIDDVLSDFYIPALSESVEYLRLAGFFSSSALAMAAKGMSNFIENGGRMKLVVGANLNKNDLEAIEKAYKEPEEVLEENMLNELEDIRSQFQKDHVEALGWLIANGNLDIKVAIVRTSSGDIVPAEEAEGIFHQKVGILEDERGNRISFSGSDNETAKAWTDNIEEFKTFREWENIEAKYFQSDLEKFKKYWNNNSVRTEVIEIPTAVKEKLIEISPEEKTDLNISRWNSEQVVEEEKDAIELWPPQKEAIENWLAADCKGIFEMATGSGKTFAALGAAKEIFEREEKLITVVACPQNPLIDQWKEEIESFGLKKDSETVIASSKNRNWKDDLQDILYDVELGSKKKIFVLTTHTTLASTDFQEMIQDVNVRRMLIVDEVHGVGATTYQKGLLDEYQYRLGLSATPQRWFDEEGTETIFSFFHEEPNSPTYRFTLEDAINSVNPETNKTYLCPYEYKPSFVEMTSEELEEYYEKTKDVRKAYHASKDKEDDDYFSLVSAQRQDIIRNADNKYNALNNILDSVERPLEKCFIYVSPEQLDTVQQMLHERNIDQHKFTENEGKTPKAKYGGLSERKYILKKFEEGIYQALVSMNLLDEGINVPSTQRAILLASTGNPRQYIQRRGRVLRHHPGKEKAIIHDIIVVPSLNKKRSRDLGELEQKIMKKEFKRYKEFAGTAMNTMECYEKIEKIEQKYGLIV